MATESKDPLPSKICSLVINPGGGYECSVWDKDYFKDKVGFLTPDIATHGYETFEASEVCGGNRANTLISARQYPILLMMDDTPFRNVLKASGYECVHSKVVLSDHAVWRLASHQDRTYHTFDSHNKERPADEFYAEALVNMTMAAAARESRKPTQ
jgi:hypothetical protein